ncbi:hypothetical protein SAMN02745121_01401 [Nannocystis exedens]|uniref:DUF4189 domain-containing protein n=1 Tax=Nannocystis exedens TaxID=54 RepID=A0A1I1UY63_9BACT|nr:hypothetical protein [Nannocystis exedens]PCC72192.1 hypothetical protein NAEX_05271 [Nannocystis exedens]SFD75726.1 hypothetical protein SAMN02745121_01401 [Nannocystis exedens]
MLQRPSAISALALACTVVLAPARAEAFCGFYVSGGDAKLYDDATLVALVRDGTRTVRSTQNNDRGPPESVALGGGCGCTSGEGGRTCLEGRVRTMQIEQAVIDAFIAAHGCEDGRDRRAARVRGGPGQPITTTAPALRLAAAPVNSRSAGMKDSR